MFDIVTLGTATRDIFLRSPLFKIVRDPKHLEKLGFKTGEAQCFALGGKLEVQEMTETIGGGAVNAAVGFARQGFKTATVFKIGKDGNGEAVIKDLKAERVAPFAAFDAKEATGYSAILLSPNGERTILHHRGASEDLRLPEIPLVKLRSRALYIAPGHIPLNVIMAVVRHFKAQGAMIAMDPSKPYIDMGAKRLAPLLKLLHIVKMNREEAAYLTGYKYEEEKKIFQKFDELVDGFAIMTDGPKGVLVSDGKKIYEAGTFKGKVVDRTGAGDAFGSGFVAGLLHYAKIDGQYTENAIRHAILVGTANGTSVVEHVGAQVGLLTKRDLLQTRFKDLHISARLLH